jgi:hypothetical protein
MLNYKILANKGILLHTNENGISEEFVDLLTKTCDYEQLTFDNDDIIIVNEHYVARPDLISLAVYGTDEYADIICKYNGISNPFELNENDIIRLPSLYNLDFMCIKKENKSELVSDSKSILTRKKYSTQKELDETRSPMESVVGETNYVIDKSMGVIFY